MLAWPFKDPDEILDYSIDWTARIDDGDSINTSTWILDIGDVVIDSDFVTGLVTTVWLSGGTIGVLSELTNRITTVEGRTMDQTVKLKIKAK